jgi:hypothetical protein
MTPERLAYEEALQDADIDLRTIRQQVYGLMVTAEALGVVVTVESVPLRPLAMGHHTLESRVRLSRDAYQRLGELRRAAEESEK